MSPNRAPEFGSYADASNEAVRARERMGEADARRGRELSRFTRRAVGWAFIIVIVAFFFAAFAGWIDVVPAR